MLNKLIQIVTALIGVTLLVTLFLRILPGNPVDAILGERATEEARQLLAQDLGLVNAQGKPLSFIQQYGQFLHQLCHNELLSFRSRQPVLNLILQRLPYTIILATSSLLIATVLGIGLGVIQAATRKNWLKRLIQVFAVTGVAIPRFWLGPMLILAFAIMIPLLPVSGAEEGLLSLVLPAFSLGTALASVLTRFTQSTLKNILLEDYIRTARAKGLSEKTILFKHALKNALIPLLTVVALQLGSLLSGAIVTERVFNWPGMGLLLLEAIQSRDIPVVQGCVVVTAFFYTLLNLLLEVSYRLIDPRMETSS